MAEKKKIELIKLTIQIGEAKVQVTKDEARDLYNALAEMFAVKIEKEYVPSYSRPWNWPCNWYGITGSASSTNYNFRESMLLDHKVGSVSLTASEYKLSD